MSGRKEKRERVEKSRAVAWVNRLNCLGECEKMKGCYMAAEVTGRRKT